MTIILMLTSLSSLFVTVTILVLLLRRLPAALDEQNASNMVNPPPPLLDSLDELCRAQLAKLNSTPIAASAPPEKELPPLKAASPSYLSEYETEQAAIEAGEVTPYYG